MDVVADSSVEQERTAAGIARELWAAMTAQRPSLRGNPEGLPLAAPARVPVRSRIHYVITSLDRDGRLADRSALQALGWPSGTRISFEKGADGFLVVTATNADEAINGQGHLCLPRSLRRACHLGRGDRVLLVACSVSGVLVGLPTYSLDRILLHYAHTLREHLDGH